MTNEIILYVTQNIVLITTVLIMAYPAIYIVRSLVEFACTALMSINVNLGKNGFLGRKEGKGF